MSKKGMKTKLVDLLKVIFQFEDQDLDFGIYRVMNQRREDIRKFIDQELISKINEQLQLMGEEQKKKILQELQELKSRVEEAYGEGAFKDGELKDKFKEYELGRKYTEKLQQLKAIEVSEDLKRDIYNHIYSFFSRYYHKGDFLSKRRFGRQDKYAIPYSGQETLLHWANKDQYYVKTTLHFKKYTFVADGITINFRVVQAEGEKGGLKADKDRYFVIHEEKPFEINGNIVNIYFEYRPLEDEEKEKRKFGKKIQISQKDVNQFNSDVLQKKLGEKEKTKPLFQKENDRTVLGKNLYKFTTSNKSDYFIHKNLKQFLSRESDFYIKNEVLGLEDMERMGKDDLDRYLLEAKVIRNISLKVIEFLSQIEKLQKKLWEKKKFVLNTDYVITLNKIKEYTGEEFLESILSEIVENSIQIREWKNLLSVDVKNSKTILNDLKSAEDSRYLTLPIDTRHFDENFKFKLLEKITSGHDLDNVLDGLLIKSENFHALNLISQRYGEKVKCIYIDPPYNTGSDEFIYKDNYQHASWLTMMSDRLRKGMELLSPDGSFFTSIDYNEMPSLRLLMQQEFGGENFRNTILFRRGVKSVQAQFDTIESLTRGYEYVLFYSKNPKARFKNLFKELDKPKPGSWNNHWRGTDRPTMRYELFGKTPTSGQWRWSEQRSKKAIENYNKMEEHFRQNNITLTQENIDRWYQREIAKTSKKRINLLRYNKKNDTVEHFIPPRTAEMLNDVWFDISPYGSRTLVSLFGKKVYDNPKPVPLVKRIVHFLTAKNGIVLDFFAGSGTTGHAVMELNKQDGGHRKFILVDFADFFDSITLTRIKKVAYSFDWKDGRPQSTNSSGGFFKYQYLEQYEDALENIQLKQRKVDEFDDYFVKYMLDFETRNSSTLLNIDDMQDPFNYKIKILETLGRPPKQVNVDLVETFNYLIGLDVNKIKVIEENDRKYLFALGEVDDVKTLVVWRSLKDIDFKQDKKIIERIRKESGPDEVYVNGDAGIRDFKQIETEFKSLLWD